MTFEVLKRIRGQHMERNADDHRRRCLTSGWLLVLVATDARAPMWCLLQAAN